MKILYIGRKDTYNYYKQGINPSHWLYGAVEMERESMNILWLDEQSAILNDARLLWQYRPDIVFIPNLNLRKHLLLLFLSAIGVLHIPIYAYLHHEPKVKRGAKA